MSTLGFMSVTLQPFPLTPVVPDISLKNQALGTELPGLRSKHKPPQRLTKSNVYAALGIFIFIVCLKLLT